MNTVASLENSTWSNSKKIGFRFFFTYFSLFIFFENNGAYPFFENLSGLFNHFLYKFIPWVGETIFGITQTIRVGPNGSGDTTYDYLLIFTVFFVSILSTIIWSLLDTKRINYLKMYYWLTLAIRLYVGLMLINYGMVKVIQLQFSAPSMSRLTQTFGDASPMGLAWTFLGFSKGYNMFMGIAEIAAVLLIFRRTMTFGLIITLMTTANVMAVNYFYDVPVKILSTHLFLMSSFLLARDFNKLCQFFFFKKTVSLAVIPKPNFKKGFNRFLLVFKILLLTYALGYGAYNTLESKEKYRGDGAKSILEGFYEVNELKINNAKVDLTFKSDITGWKYLMVEGNRFAQIRFGNNKKNWFKIKIDSIKKELELTDYRDSLNVYNLKYNEGAKFNFYLKGIVKKDTISIKLKRTKNYQEKFLLTNRGFHWINEVPYNR